MREQEFQTQEFPKPHLTHDKTAVLLQRERRRLGDLQDGTQQETQKGVDLAHRER